MYFIGNILKVRRRLAQSDSVLVIGSSLQVYSSYRNTQTSQLINKSRVNPHEPSCPSVGRSVMNSLKVAGSYTSMLLLQQYVKSKVDHCVIDSFLKRKFD